MYKIMKIYYDKTTGEQLWAASYNQSTTVDFDHDYNNVIDLKSRDKDSIGLLLLKDGQYAQDFAESVGYRVNPETKTLEFSYSDPDLPTEEDLIYQAPLSEQVRILELELGSTKDQLRTTDANLMEFMDYYFTNGGV